MGWARMDDGYMFHPKILDAGPWAELLDRRAIEHCAKNETDGLVVRSALALLARGIPKPTERVTTLLEVGRWTVNEGGGWWIHDFLEYNPSKAAKDQIRALGKERQSKLRNARRNAVTPDGQTKYDTGEGKSLSLQPQGQRVRSIERCRTCGELDLDCQCGQVNHAS